MTADTVQIREARLADVDRAVAGLVGARPPSHHTLFADKLTRYVQKPDRTAFIALLSERVIGYSTVIQASDIPPELAPEMRRRLEGHACGTGVAVAAAMRGRGIGKSLVRQWSIWARARDRSGVWLVTHRMAGWYRRHLDYAFIGHVTVGTVTKSVMARELSIGAP